MCRLRNIVKCDYQESMTTRQTDAGQSDPYVLLYFAGNTINYETTEDAAARLQRKFQILMSHRPIHGPELLCNLAKNGL